MLLVEPLRIREDKDMGKKENKDYGDIFNVTVDASVPESPKAVVTPVIKKEYKTLMEAAKALANGEIMADDVSKLSFNENDVKAVANHLRNSK